MAAAMSWRGNLGATPAAAAMSVDEGAGAGKDRKPPRRDDARKDRKGGGGGAADDDQLVDMMAHLEVMAKQVLSNSQGLRQVQGALSVTYLGPVRFAPVAAGLAEGARYAAAVRDMGQGHKMGSPHVWVLMGFLEAAKQLVADEGGGQSSAGGKGRGAGKPTSFLSPEVSSDLTAAHTFLSAQPLRVSEFVPIFMVKECYHKGGENEVKRAKVSVMVDPLPTMEVAGLKGGELAMRVKAMVHEIMMVGGSEAHFGALPRGPMERALQTHIKKLGSR